MKQRDQRKRPRGLADLLVWIGGSVLLLAACSPIASPSSSAPPSDRSVVLWVWQRGEDLSFLGDVHLKAEAPRPATVSAAVWVGTARWSLARGEEAAGRRTPVVQFENRSVPVLVHSDRVSRVVVRLENATGEPGVVPDVEALAHQIVRHSRSSLVSWPDAALQIDFDAATSERAFYRGVLRAVRTALPDVRLEITALLSWCQEPGDTGAWLESLPVDGVVPMAFRLGRDEAVYRRLAEAGAPLRHDVCRESLGLALDEDPSAFASWARSTDELFLFPDTPWTAAQVRRGLEVVGWELSPPR